MTTAERAELITLLDEFYTDQFQFAFPTQFQSVMTVEVTYTFPGVLGADIELEFDAKFVFVGGSIDSAMVEEALQNANYASFVHDYLYFSSSQLSNIDLAFYAAPVPVP